MKRQPKIGLLPFFLKLYDDTMPTIRLEFEPFITTVVDGLAAEDVSAVRADICRVEPEFREAARRFQQEDVDLIITLHLAYSPSLESIEALTSIARPILILDTTMDYDFGRNIDAERIMFNHGVHGVQDLTSMLRRKGIRFEIVAGHITQSNVLKRAADIARAAYAARILRAVKVLRIGETFRGMGDFAVPDRILQEVFGISVDEIGLEVLADEIEGVSNPEIEDEIRRDRERFTVNLAENVHRRSVQVGLALRRLLEKGNYAAFSMNFLAFTSVEGSVDTIPFLEASKAMGRGLGYAGEGDVLTASLVAALNGAFGRTTFTEVFCPDWKGGSLFLSHMGEINPEVAAKMPRLCEKVFPWTDARHPAIITCAPAPGPAVLVNLAPGPDDTFSLIISPVEVLGDTTNPALNDSVRGWIRPLCPLETFLEQYSRFGGTHHSALVLGDHTEAIAAFASFAGIEWKIIK